ncbi:acyl-CoA thioesterase [Mycobacterium paraterrae]|uniref:Thioesterase family protein n=1 Tax=Mycobacterium paraterrae TaxID=577492 RepID=A0ABY3VXR8_9MYCO|nr:acyl-CoA thioesterase domain-containing protein [Mycobacterium paraterrae]UMB71976.1 thioesterase family protein [Mycobacterium paraterrae]
MTSAPVITLDQLLDSLELEQVNAEFFVGNQLDEIAHHISGGHIAAQALMAASRTVVDRLPHSMHMYFLRAGDARQPVDFEVTTLHDGGTFSARRVAARQFGSVLLEGVASFSKDVENIVYQQLPPDLPDPDTVPTFAEQHRELADERDGWWVREQPIDYRYVDPSARLAADLVEQPSAGIRMWWRPSGIAPSDPIVADCLTAFVAGRTLLESAMIARRTTPLGPGFSALMDLAMWFHHPPDLSDWILYQQHSPSGIGGRGLAQGTMFNRTGQLVCTTTLECYFGGKPRG